MLFPLHAKVAVVETAAIASYMAHGMPFHFWLVASILHSCLCADPLPTDQMYYDCLDGQRRTIRGTSQLESLHRYLDASMPGTHMGIEGADYAIVNFCYR